MILAGDIGGTKTLLALFEIENKELVERRKEKFTSSEYDSIESILNEFFKDDAFNIHAAAFGVPGPVFGSKVKLTNLDWVLDQEVTSSYLKIENVKMINDLGATAFAIPYLKNEELITIKEGSKDFYSKRFSVLAPGTGLGEAFLICDGKKEIILSSEGGHTDFAPTNELESDLNNFLREKFGRVSYERIISGTGLPNIFDFLMEKGYGLPHHLTIERFKNEDRAVVISDMALNRTDKLCCDALEIFISVLGAHAGNMVLTNLTTGGVYLGGGIPHKIKSLLSGKIFSNSFISKGRLKSLLEATPVYLINNNEAALKGAAWYANSLIKN